MKIVVATPLYPPDRAEPALYVKELVRRLSANHTVTVVAYGTHLEKVPDVAMIAVNKQRPLPLRLLAFYDALRRAVRGADLLIIENGASVELPAGILARMTPLPLVIHRGDITAHAHAKQRAMLTHIERFVEQKALRVVDDRPLPRPEILPFGERPTEALAASEESWTRHLRTLLTHA